MIYSFSYDVRKIVSFFLFRRVIAMKFRSTCVVAPQDVSPRATSCKHFNPHLFATTSTLQLNDEYHYDHNQYREGDLELRSGILKDTC